MKNKITKIGYKHTEATKNKMSDNHKGKKFSEEHKRKIGLGNKGKVRTEETKRKISLSLIGNKRNLGHHCSIETKEIISKTHKGKITSKATKEKMSLAHLNKTEEEKSKFIKSILKNRKIYKNEAILYEIIKENNLPFNYTGNGQIVMNGFCPDFLSKNPKHIIELFGSRHYGKYDKIRDKRRFKAYSSLGYKTLVIYNWELNEKRNHRINVINKIKNFVNQQ
jgi:very-short-patch-repair endonuclease